MSSRADVELDARRGTEVELFSLAGHDGHLREVNEAFALLLGRSSSEINGRSILELVDPADVGQVVAGLAALEAGDSEVLFECRFRQDDGTHVHLQWVARTVPGTDSWWAAGRDTTDFHRLLDERLDMRARLDLALGNAGAAMWELDVTKPLLTWEPEAAAILGVAGDALPASAAELAALVHPQDAAALQNAFEQLLAAGSATTGVRVGDDAALRHLSLRGKVLARDRRGRPTRAVGVVLDVTTEKAMEEQMLRMVMTDALTGVANRRAFDKALRGEWRRCHRSGEPISVLIVDIDHFKHFNDTFGHLVGDAALVAVARAMAAPLEREGDLLARFGGEEFAVVLPGADADGARKVALDLMGAVHAITLRQADDASLTVSVGTASWGPGTPLSKADELLGRADEALYAAKSAGRDRAVAYESALAARATLEGAIAQGLEDREFELHYQPVVALGSGDVVALEALMRWNRPGHGLQAPAAFIPVAEGSELICDLDRWAMHEATAQLARWSEELADALGDVRVAVNVSGRHASTTSLVDDVAAALSASGLEPGRLELELTETMLAADALVGVHLAAVRALGVRVALDDFGTGSTSIAQIARLPADVLKIDRSFIASAEPGHQKLVAFIVEAAHTFGLDVVAEGVEHEETLLGLDAMGCDTAQGYLIARPMPARRVAAWLRERNAEATIAGAQESDSATGLTAGV